MSHYEMSVTGSSKCHHQSHINESCKSSPALDSFTTCMQCSSNKTRSHNCSTDKTKREKLEEDKKTEVKETMVKKINKESVPKGDDKAEVENIEDVARVSTKPIQNAHPMSSQEDSHLFNYFSKEDDEAANKSMEDWERERSLPWSRGGDREQNLSVPMFLYLLNNDIKSEICDLEHKESEACQAHKWDEALRMRELTHKLHLAREHQLLNAVGLKLDEETRSIGMKNIAMRQDVVDKREKLISDGNLYSEEAKELWKKWESEDDQLGLKSSFIERAGFMHSLEEEWKILADEDKERISQFYGKNVPVLPTDHRHKLTNYRQHWQRSNFLMLKY